MYCHSCKSIIPNTGASFCPNCGNPLYKTCQSCGRTYPYGTNTCPFCKQHKKRKEKVRASVSYSQGLNSQNARAKSEENGCLKVLLLVCFIAVFALMIALGPMFPIVGIPLAAIAYGLKNWMGNLNNN